MTNTDSLTPGKIYHFHTKDFVTPHDEVISGEVKTRIFRRSVSSGPVGMPQVPFIEVERGDGRTHMIAVETISRFDEALIAP